MKLTITVKPDEITEKLSKAFDYAFDGTSTTEIRDLPELPSDFALGLIVGPSGSGKSSLLQEIPGRSGGPIRWSNAKAVASHFKDADDAMQRFAAVGLNSIPAWCRPFYTLSTGEQFRAEIARQLGDEARSQRR